MFPEIAVLVGVSFLVGFMFRSHWAKKEERRWSHDVLMAQNDRHHFIYRWNVATCRLEAIQKMATDVLEGESRDGIGGPYRADSTQLVETLELIRDKSDETLKEIVREVGCFKSLDEVEEWLDDWDEWNTHGNSPDPLIIKRKDYGNPCWHIILGSDDEDEDEDEKTNLEPDEMFQALDRVVEYAARDENARVIARIEYTEPPMMSPKEIFEARKHLESRCSCPGCEDDDDLCAGPVRTAIPPGAMWRQK